MIKKFLFVIGLFAMLLGCDNKTLDRKTTSANDSISKYLALAGNDTLDFDKRIKYNDRALSFIDLEKNDSLTRENLNILIYNYLSTKDHIKFKKLSPYYFDKTIKTHDSLGLARYYRYNGGYFRNIGVYDSSFYYYLKSEKLYKQLKEEEGVAIIRTNMAHIQFKLDDYLGCLLSAERAFRYFKKVGDIDKQFHLLIKIGNSNHNLNNYEKAISNFRQAILLCDKLDLKGKKFSYLATCLNNIGNAYRVQKKYKKAVYYFKTGLKEKNLINKDPEVYAYMINNLGFCYLKSGNYSMLPNFFYESKKIFDSLGIKNESAICDIYLSEFYHKKGNKNKAHFHAESALQLSKEAIAPYYYLTALTHAGSINPEKAPKYIQEYHHINDSLLFAERNARNQYYKIQLETDEINQEKNIAQKQRTITTAIALTLLLISILIFIIARQRIRQKELRLHKTQQESNERIFELMLTQKKKEEKARQKEKKRISLELHDGVMNKLSNTRLHLSMLSFNQDNKTIEKCIKYIAEIQDIEKEIRNIAHDLNQEVLTGSNSFEKLLQDFVEEQNNISNTSFKLEIDKAINWELISDHKKMNLYRIIQEASHNINKHAKAKKAIISILKDTQNIILSITDDGIGFQNSASENGIGLNNMKYRVTLLKGKFAIRSKANSANSINITIPLEALN